MKLNGTTKPTTKPSAESTKDLNATSDEQTASEREGGKGKRREKDASRFPSLGKLNPPRRSGAELGASFVASLE